MPSTRAVCALLVALSATSALAAERYSAAQLERQLGSLPSQQAREQLAKATPSKLPPLIRQQLANLSADPVLAESLLHRALLRLREPGMPRDADSRAMLQGLLGYSPQVLVPPADPDHGRGLWVPAYDLAAAARGTLAIWQAQEAEQAARNALDRRDYASLRRLPAEPLAAALRQSPLAPLKPLGDQGPWPDAVLAVLAERLADLDLGMQLLAQAEEANLLNALPVLASALPPADAMRWLQTLIEQRPALASAALLTMARTQPQSSPDYLLAQLDSAGRGSSAAQALATIRTPRVRAALADILARDADGPRLRRALLALHWMDDAAARERLQAFADAGTAPAALRREVTTWLR